MFNNIIKKDDNNFPLIVSPLITQMRTAYFSMDCGMCYVIRLGDGRFVLLDSNTGEYEETERLWDTLNSQNVIDEKPRIAAWFISHAHIDHFGGFVKFMDKYGDKVVLENLLYHWPESQYVYPASELNSLDNFDRVVEKIKNYINIITPHSGEKYIFGDAEFDVLFACEDLYPEFIPNFNDSSLVIMMKLAGKKVLWLGDMQKQGAEYMCQKYPKEVFECDILQVGHHGYNSACDTLHRMADPEILLWPCPDFWYPVVKYWDENKYLITSSKIRTIHISGQAESVLDLTKPIPDFKPYKEFNNGETVYEENFEGDRVIDLGWSCITGGSTGYKAALASISKGECVLENNFPENYTVCQFIQPGLIELNPDFTLEFTGKISKNYDYFGLFWDYNKPTVFSEDRALKLFPESEKEFKYMLKADFNKKSARLYLNGNLIKEMEYTEIGGLHFILKNATLILSNIKITRGI